EFSVTPPAPPALAGTRGPLDGAAPVPAAPATGFAAEIAPGVSFRQAPQPPPPPPVVPSAATPLMVPRTPPMAPAAAPAAPNASGRSFELMVGGRWAGWAGALVVV